MKIIYEQGDLVYNHNNESYAIVIGDVLDHVTIIELLGDKVIINSPPKSALSYLEKVNVHDELKQVILNKLFKNI